MIKFELADKNIQPYLDLAIDLVSYPLRANYETYKDQAALDEQIIFIEYDTVCSLDNSNMIAVPLKNGKYYIESGENSPINTGTICSEEEVVNLLKKSKDAYNNMGYKFYYKGI